MSVLVKFPDILENDNSRIFRLERGHAKPTAKEICALCLVYGRSVEHLFRLTTRSLIAPLKKRLSQIPPEPANWSRQHDRRLDTLNGLHHRLRELGYEEEA